MESGILPLVNLYGLVGGASSCEELLQLSGPRAPGKAYTKLCDAVAARIPQTQGFYLWGSYDRKGLWRNIYLGKAGIGRTASLRSRILEELKDERCFLWRAFRTQEEILSVGQRIHSQMWKEYQSQWRRALLKEGTTYIAWVSTPAIANEDVLRIQADLIESLNPSANIKRPAPPKNLQSDTRDVFEAMRLNIHHERQGKFVISLFTVRGV